MLPYYQKFDYGVDANDESPKYGHKKPVVFTINLLFTSNNKVSL